VRLRLEGGFQCSPDPPSRRRLQRLLRMRPRETVGITARDTLCRHGRACPGHPDAVRRSALRIGITGTGPVMTRGCVQCSHFVIDTMYHLGSTLAHPGPTGRALARRRRCGAGSGPAAGLARRLAGGPWQPCAGPSRNASQSRVRGAVRLLPFHHTHRAGLPSAPSSINYTARSASCGPAGPCLVQSHCFRRKRQYSQVQVNTMIVSTNG
jgi:hypothetical protein